LAECAPALGVDELLDLPLPFMLGLFLAGAGSAAVEGLSFWTIFAWISCSFDALTFFGQKSVTNLSV
jgi:hypothetical protein